MDKHCLIFAVFFVLLGNTTALKLDLFDSPGFLGPILTATNAEACTNLTTTNFQQARSLKTDTCIMIFRAVDCTSYSIRLDPGEYYDLAQVKHETVNFVNPESYRLCSPSVGGQDVNADIYGNAITMDGSLEPYSGILLRYRDICSCINLSTKDHYIGNITGIYNFGNCIKIYDSTNCAGTGLELLGGVSPYSESLWAHMGSFIIPSTSIGLCSHRPSCYSLNSTAFKFELSINEEKRLKMSVDSDMAITSKAKFVNNGSATVTQEYEAKTTITETVEVSKVTRFSSTDTYSTVRSVVTTGYVGFLFWRTRIVSTLTEAYTKTNTSEEENGEKYISTESREVSVKQTIQIPPCSEYEVDSLVTMTSNLPVDYNVYFYVSGVSKGLQLTANEVMERLTPGLSYVEDYDNNTVIAMGSGTILADLSAEALIQGEGAPIAGCVPDTQIPFK